MSFWGIFLSCTSEHQKLTLLDLYSAHEFLCAFNSQGKKTTPFISKRSLVLSVIRGNEGKSLALGALVEHRSAKCMNRVADPRR